MNKIQMTNKFLIFKCSNKEHNFLPGFTMIELLIVVAVIIILLGLLTTAGTNARKKAKISQAKAMIASLETALAMYHVDFGDYPCSGNQNLVNLLAYTGNLSYSDWQGPYMSFKAENLNGAMPNATLRDPWGSDYNYLYDTTVTPPRYTIASAGPDMSFDTGDDITNN